MPGLGIVIPKTGGTGPRIPHSAGVTGYSSRYIMNYLDGADGTFATSFPDQMNVRNLTPATSPSSFALATTAGIGRHITNVSTVVNNCTPLVFDPVTPVTFCAVARSTKMVNDFIGINGYRFRRATNGVWQVAGNVSQFLTAPGSSNWACLIGVCNAPNLTLYVDGLAPASGPITQPISTSLNGLLTTSIVGQVDIAEIISWPSLLDATQAAAVRTAMKAKYLLLP